MKIMVTGSAGFIGFHFAKNILDDGFEVLGIDNMNDYYDPQLKEARLAELKCFDNFTFKKIDIVVHPQSIILRRNIFSTLLRKNLLDTRNLKNGKCTKITIKNMVPQGERN